MSDILRVKLPAPTFYPTRALPNREEVLKRKWLVLGVGSTVGENEYGSYFAAGTPMKQFVRHRLEPTLLPFEEKILGEKVCPFCAETIKAEAIKCKHCGSDLGE